MGTTASCIHIYGDFPKENIPFAFKSFSPGWYTCVEDFSEKDTEYPYKTARFIASKIENPVVYFSVYDSEAVFFEVLRGRKIVARYSDNSCEANKKIYDIPALLGAEECGKKRLSSIFSCADIDLKIAMLEEYFGAPLLYFPEAEEEELAREKSDSLYRKYEEEEKRLTGKHAPFKAEIVAEYPGKLFTHYFTVRAELKEHYFLFGYSEEKSSELAPVHFTGKMLENADLTEKIADVNRIRAGHEKYFSIKYGTPCKVTFTDNCPEAYLGKTMALPIGFYPCGFLGTGELILEGNKRIYIADASLKVVAKLPIKGDIADLVGNYMLTTVGNSFFAYVYEPGAKVCIYKIEKR
ncbi:MAG: hypothetical protein IJW21_06865 [Clostridia bacterium]|nr:hypothetical protein [Clostridia bacterium]